MVLAVVAQGPAGSPLFSDTGPRSGVDNASSHGEAHEMKQMGCAAVSMYATVGGSSLTADVGRWTGMDLKKRCQLADALQKRCRTGGRGASSPPVLQKQAGAT